MATEINTKYESYVHIGNSGFTISVEVESNDAGYVSQYLTTGLHAFGLPHETKMWLDDNVLDALEYILQKAREQRKTIPQEKWKITGKAVPPHTHEHSCTNNTSEKSPE